MSLPPIIIDFIGRDGKFQAVAAGVEARLQGMQSRIVSVGARMQAMGDRFQSVGRRMSYLSAAVAGSAGGLYLLAKRSAEAGDSVAKAARQAGVGVEYWQRHAYALGQVTDISDGELSLSMTRLTKLIGEAATGSETASASLQRLGFSQEELASGSVTTEAAFDAYLQAVDKVKAPTEAAALAADLFGKSGAALGAQLVGAGGEMAALRTEADALGLVMGEDSTAQSEKFMDSIDRIGARLQQLGRDMAEKLIPVFNDKLFPLFEDKILPAFEKLVGWIGDGIKYFGDLPEPVQEAALAIAGAFAIGAPALIALGVLASAIGALVSGPGAVLVLLAGAAALILAAWNTWGEEFKALIGPYIDYVEVKIRTLMKTIELMVSGLRRFSAAVRSFLSVDRSSLPDYGSSENDLGVFSDSPGTLGGGTGGLAIGGGGGGGIGRNLADGLAGGVEQGLIERSEGLRASLGMVTDLARDVFQTQSPSLVFEGIGMNIGEGLANGLANAQGLVAAATRVLTGAVPKETAEAVSSILGSLGTLFTKAKGFGIAQALVNIGIGMSEALKLPFPANIAAMAKTAASGAQALATIRGASPSGGGSIAGGGGGGGGAGAAPSRPQEVLVRAQGPLSDLLNGVIGGLADQLRKDFGDSGYIIASGVR